MLFSKYAVEYIVSLIFNSCDHFICFGNSFWDRSITRNWLSYNYNVRVNSSHEHPPTRMGILQLIVSWSPGHLQTTTNLPHNILWSFSTALKKSRVSTPSFWNKKSIWRTQKTNRNNKTIYFALVRSECFISWPYSPWCNMVVHVRGIYYTMNIGRMHWGRALDHHSRNGGRGGGDICQYWKLPAGPSIWSYFQMPRVCPGGCSRLEMTRT